MFNTFHSSNNEISYQNILEESSLDDLLIVFSPFKSVAGAFIVHVVECCCCCCCLHFFCRFFPFGSFCCDLNTFQIETNGECFCCFECFFFLQRNQNRIEQSMLQFDGPWVWAGAISKCICQWKKVILLTQNIRKIKKNHVSLRWFACSCKRYSGSIFFEHSAYTLSAY